MKIKDILQSIKLSEIISKYIKLEEEKNGEKIGLCPFHNEKTPSFSINDDKGVYYCFGCKKSGNAINFLSEYLHIDIKEAIRELKNITGNTHYEKKDNVLELNKAFEYYTNDLIKKKDMFKNFVLNRGYNESVIDDFKLGFIGSFVMLKFSKNDKYKSGLFKSENQLRHINKIVIPLHDENNNTVGFSFRAIDDSKPKYLNTFENEYFKKRNMLYGLNKAKEQIKEKDSVIIVEGQFDVISMHNSGYKNTVGVMGSVLNQTHIKLIKKYTNNIILLFDGDEAGIHAIENSILICLRNNIEPSICFLPKKIDPDEACRSGNIEKYLSKKYMWTDFFVLKVMALKKSVEKQNEIQRIREVLSGQSVFVITDIEKRFKEEFNIDLNIKRNRIDIKEMLVKKTYEDHLMLYMINNLEYLENGTICSATFEEEINIKRFNLLKKHYDKYKKDFKIGLIIGSRLFNNIRECINNPVYREKVQDHINYIFKMLKIESFNKEKFLISNKINESKDIEETKELSKRLMEIIRYLSEIKSGK